MPLNSTDDRLLGVMEVSDPINRQRPTMRTTELLEILADQAAIAIENNYLLREARSTAEQMTILFQVGVAAASTVDLDILLKRVYQQIVSYKACPVIFSWHRICHNGSRCGLSCLWNTGKWFGGCTRQSFPKLV